MSKILTQMPLSPELVKAAYLFLLGREVENEEVALMGVNYHKNVAQLREYLICSVEGSKSLLEVLTRIAPFETAIFRSRRGIDIELNLNDTGLTSSIISRDEFEVHIETLIREYLSPDQTFVDVGANIGWFTLIAAKLITEQSSNQKKQKGQVLAFEANPNTAAILIRNIARNQYTNIVVPYVLGLGTEMSTGYVDVAMQGNISGASVYEDQLEQLNLSQIEIREKYLETDESFGLDGLKAITIFSLDEVLKSYSQKIGLIKIDIEGGEFKVLQGAIEILNSHKPVVLLELHWDKLLFVSGVRPSEVLHFFERISYMVVDPTNDVSKPLTGPEIDKIVLDNGYFDFLALNKEKL